MQLGNVSLRREGFAHDELHSSRRAAIAAAREAQLANLLQPDIAHRGRVGQGWQCLTFCLVLRGPVPKVGLVLGGPAVFCCECPTSLDLCSANPSGTLGRQGSVGVLEEIERLLDQRGASIYCSKC